MNDEYKFTPRNPSGVFEVVLPARISTPHQDLKSIDATQKDNEQWLRDKYKGPLAVMPIGRQTSGWTVKRPEIEYVKARIMRREIDLVLLSEIRDLFRNPKLIWEFVHLCVDHDVRLIIRWGSVDTAREDWETQLNVAVLIASVQVPETRRRVRRKAEHEFKQGGWVQKIKFGYRKLSRDEAATGKEGPVGLRQVKKPEDTLTIMEMRRCVLFGGHTDTMVAHWLNASGVSPGPYAESKRWTGRLVRELLTDRILSGRRQYRKTLSRFFYGVGEHKAVHNPTPLNDDAEALAHMTPEEQQPLLDYYAARKARRGNHQKAGKESPIYNVPRGQSLWPGMGLQCGACGKPYYQSGKVLKCQGAGADRIHACWNHTQVDRETVRDRVLTLFLKVLDADPQGRQAVSGYAWSVYQTAASGADAELNYIDNEMKAIARIKANALKLLATHPDIESVAQTLSDVQSKEKQFAHRKAEILAMRAAKTNYRSAAEIEANLVPILRGMMAESRDFGVFLRMIVKARVEPVQGFDCPQVRPRLVVRFTFGEFLPPDAARVDPEFVIDLFEAPKHVLHMSACLAAKQAHPKWSLKKIAAATGINYMTVKRALDYARRWEAAGRPDHYRVLTEPPAAASRWRQRRRSFNEEPNANPNSDSAAA